MPKRLAHCARRRPPFFHPVPLRARADGWSDARQCEFLTALYVTGSVAAAVRAVGMTRTSAYRLRKRPGGGVLTPPGSGHACGPEEVSRKVTLRKLNRWLETGLVQPVIYQKRMTAIRRKPDNSALFRLLRRQDAGRDLFGPEGDAG